MTAGPMTAVERTPYQIARQIVCEEWQQAVKEFGLTPGSVTEKVVGSIIGRLDATAWPAPTQGSGDEQELLCHLCDVVAQYSLETPNHFLSTKTRDRLIQQARDTLPAPPAAQTSHHSGQALSSQERQK